MFLVLTALAVPMVVALVALRDPTWFPTLDLAMTELKLRDVGTADTPLIGLAGRIGPLGDQGSHPGPLGYYALWPLYRLFGADAFAMQVATVALHLVAAGLALLAAGQRGGRALVLGVGTALAALVHLYGSEVLTEPWNPHLPVLWWFLLLLAVWSTLCGDLRWLPVAVLAGSLSMQTHVPYLASGGALVLLAVTVSAVSALTLRDGRRGPRWRWLAVAALVGVLAWVPPVLDQFTATEGNLTKLWDAFGSPEEPVLGLGDGAALLVRHLDPGRLVTGNQLGDEPTGSLVPGLAMLVAWAASVALAVRARHRTLLRLDAVLAVGLLVGWLSASRILGFVWYYLSFSAYGVAALLVVATVWTLAAVAGPHLGERRHRAAQVGLVALGGAVVVLAAASSFEARDARTSYPERSEALARLLPGTVAAMEATDEDERWLVSFEIDPVALGAQGFGLLLELERRGFDVEVPELHRPGATPSRVRAVADSTSVVHLAVGPGDLQAWRTRAGAREVASFEPRTAAEAGEYERLCRVVGAALDRAGLDDLTQVFRRVPFIAALDPRLPASVEGRIERMVELGLPSAVFIAPAEVVQERWAGRDELSPSTACATT